MARSHLLAAALLTAVLAGPALAQESPATGEGNVPAPTTGTQTDTTVQSAAPDTDTTRSIGAPIDGAAALNAIQGAGDTARQIGTIKAVSTVHVVSLSEIKGADASALKDATAANKAGIDSLRDALEASDALKAKLTQASVAPATVVGTRIEADGAVTVFTE